MYRIGIKPDYRIPSSEGDFATALNREIAAASADGGGQVVIPDGGQEYLITTPIIIRSNVELVGFGRSKLKLADEANCNIIETLDFQTATGTDTTAVPSGFQIRGVKVDGNSANNDTPGSNEGHGIAIYGRDFVVEDVFVEDTKRTGLWTEYSSSGTSPYNARVTRVTVDSPGEHGWFNDCSDLHFTSVNIKSASQTTDNTYDAVHFTSAVRGSVLNTWRGGGASNTHRYSVYSEGGCIISNLSLETAKTAQVYLNGDNNRLTNLWSYNLLGGDHIVDLGDFNSVTALITQGGLGVTTAYGLVIQGANTWGATHEITTSATLAGLVNFVSSAGGNRITGRCREINNPLVNGTPNASDIVEITADGSSDGENVSYSKWASRPGTLSAAGSSSQGDATLIETTVTRVFSDNAVRGVRLPDAVEGLHFYLGNTGANAAQVYPATGDNFIGAAANAAITLAADSSMHVVCHSGTEWTYLTS